MALSRGLAGAVVIHILFGAPSQYVVVSMNILEPYIMQFANESIFERFGTKLSSSSFAWLWSGLATLEHVSSLCTALLFTLLLDYFGRRNSYMRLMNVVLILACLLQATAKSVDSVEALAAGRLFTGVSIALCFAPGMVFVSESSPLRHRGQASQVLAIGHLLWGIAAVLLALPSCFGSDKSWSYYYLIPIPFALIHLLSSLAIPASPKFLYLKRNEVDKARKSLRFYHGPNYDEDEIFSQFEHESDQAAHGLSLRMIWKQRHLRQPFIICIVAQVAPYLAGHQFAMDYGLPIFRFIGLSQKRAIIVSFFGTILQTVGLFAVSLGLMERVGRRRLFLFALASQLAAILCITIAAWKQPGDNFGRDIQVEMSSAAWCFTVGSVVFGVCYNSVQPLFIATLLLGEICPQGTRAKVTQVVMTIRYLVSICFSLSIPPLVTALGSRACLLFIAMGVLCFAWLWCNLPETKQRPVQDLVAEFRGEEEPLLAVNDGLVEVW